MFQSTPPRRRRHQQDKTYLHLILFQSTPPRRRRLVIALDKDVPSFNPRLREGGDTVSDEDEKNVLFQSTPPRRRRRFRKTHTHGGYMFQSTPPRRRRPQHIVILQLSCTYLVLTTFLSAIFSFISQYVVLFFLF